MMDVCLRYIIVIYFIDCGFEPSTIRWLWRTAGYCLFHVTSFTLVRSQFLDVLGCKPSW